MRKFMINVNGKSYEVEVEEIKDGVIAAPAAQPAPRAAAPAAPKAAPAPAPKAAPAAVPAGASTVTAPMPGTILSISVKAGDAVKKGQVLCILEAMKMENEIMAGGDGTVASVAVSQGDSVSTGQVLFALA
ncbi:MAG: acetyl-CoA carboxylase biotin carboxyl carrier protein subunit [Clostridia bacterium BRH_c25]|nr:MAG: acetyl-CoA carboxylase biotin carboxyl carrier protein subunit [Clostridia bacterium BRH_c25]